MQTNKYLIFKSYFLLQFSGQTRKLISHIGLSSLKTVGVTNLTIYNTKAYTVFPLISALGAY